MKKLTILIIFSTLLITACNKDGVPKIEDPDNILVDGEKVTAQAFYDKYCKLKPSNETCISVEKSATKQKSQDAVKNALKHSASHATPDL